MKLGKPELPRTWLLDIDGTLVKHFGRMSDILTNQAEALDDVLDKLNQMGAAGDKIILTTGRPSTMRQLTEVQLADLGIFYDQLVMDCGIGDRIVVNDARPDSGRPTAHAVTVERNKGLGSLDLTRE